MVNFPQTNRAIVLEGHAGTSTRKTLSRSNFHFSQGFRRSEHLSGMAVALHLGSNSGEFPVWSDPEGSPYDTHEGFSVPRFCSADARPDRALVLRLERVLRRASACGEWGHVPSFRRFRRVILAGNGLVEFRANDRAEGRNGRAGAVEPAVAAREGMPDQA
jgi:hypothetical protein